ncbi:MAG: 4Fe-4S dicluster domain-containing protein [Desulfovibrionales bacterium]|nr:MAG: 4Fe-4S dicluster domain-containing protein [Desulfovibrionales bacterium]
MAINRRTFLKAAGLTTLAGVAGHAAMELLTPGALEAARPESVGRFPEELTAKRWAMLIDTEKFTTAQTFQRCIDACHVLHNVPHIPGDKEIKWLWTDSFKHVFPDQQHDLIPEAIKNQPFLALCNHCDNPPCVRVCPTKATFKRDDGIVMMDMHRCIGCRYCMAGCPYGARSFNFWDPRPFIANIDPYYPTRMIGVVEKCTFCEDRLARGQIPACVEVSEGAMLFGDLDNQDSEVRRVLRERFSLRRKPSLGTKPHVFYLI